MRVYFENTESGRNESALLVGEVVDAAMEVSEEIEAAKVSRSKKKKTKRAAVDWFGLHFVGKGANGQLLRVELNIMIMII